MGPDPFPTSASTTAPPSRPDYEQRLETIIARLQKPAPKLIWAAATPLPAESKYGATAAMVSDIIAFGGQRPWLLAPISVSRRSSGDGR